MSRRCAGCFFDGRNVGRCGGTVGQSGQCVLHEAVGAFAVYIADDGDDGIVFAVAGAVKRADVVKRDAVYALYGGVCVFAVRVVGIREARQCSGGGEVGFGFLLLQEGGGLCLVAAEHSFVETRAGQCAVEQGNGFFECVRTAQAAQGGGGGFVVRTAADFNCQSVGLGVEGFFVHFFCAAGQQGGGEGGGFAFAVGIGRVACASEADCHVDNRIFMPLGQEDLHALRGGPALDVDRCLYGQGQDKGEEGRSVFHCFSFRTVFFRGSIVQVRGMKHPLTGRLRRFNCLAAEN